MELRIHWGVLGNQCVPAGAFSSLCAPGAACNSGSPGSQYSMWMLIRSGPWLKVLQYRHGCFNRPQSARLPRLPGIQVRNTLSLSLVFPSRLPLELSSALPV